MTAQKVTLQPKQPKNPAALNRPPKPEQVAQMRAMEQVAVSAEAAAVRQAEEAGLVAPVPDMQYEDPHEAMLKHLASKGMLPPAPPPGGPTQEPTREPDPQQIANENARRAIEEAQRIVAANDTDANVADDPLPPGPPHKAAPPPQTREQFARQQNEPISQYYDVAEVFMGNTPVKPSTGFVNPFEQIEKPSRPAPPQEERYSEIAICTPGMEEMRRAYIFTEDTTAWVNDMTQYFKKGQVISERWQVDPILSGGCKTLVPIDQASNFITCPMCAHAFPEAQSKPLIG